MRLAHVSLLEDFGTRSLTIHGIMVLAFVNAIFVGLFIGGQLGTVSFVALLNFTAGLWVAHSVHSLGNAIGDDDYAGILNELFQTIDHPGMDIGRFGRLLSLVAAVTAISLLTSGQVLSGAILSVAIVAVGSIAVMTSMVGFLIAIGASYDASQERTIDEIERRRTKNGISDEQAGEK